MTTAQDREAAVVEAVGSGTATTFAPASPNGTDQPIDAIDADVIRRTYTAVLSATRPLPIDDQERIGTLLRGHVQLLVPELAAAAPLLQGAWRGTADHVLASSRRVLAADAGTSADALYELALQCRALLAVRQHAAPLTCLTARTTEGRP